MVTRWLPGVLLAALYALWPGLLRPSRSAGVTRRRMRCPANWLREIDAEVHGLA